MAKTIKEQFQSRCRLTIASLWYILMMAGWVIMIVWISPWGLVISATVLLPCVAFALIHDGTKRRSEFTTDAWAVFLVYWFTAFLRKNNPIDVTTLFNVGVTGLVILGIVWFLIDNRAHQKRTVDQA